MHQLSSFGQREAELKGPELDHLARRAQPCQRQRGIGPRDQHDPCGGRQVLKEERHLLVAACLGDRVIVVEHEDNRGRKRRQLVDQGREHGYGVGDLDLTAWHEGLAAEFRASAPERMGDVPPQPGRVIVTLVERDPGEPLALHRAGPPLRDESRLAEARGRINQDDPGPGGGVGQPLDKVWPLDPVLTDSWGVELCRQRHRQAGPA